MSYRIERSLCRGCGACAVACLFGAPVCDDGDAVYTIAEDVCMSCGRCRDVCPTDAISMSKDTKPIKEVVLDANICIGCSLCAKACPADAISGVIKSPYKINRERCIRCGLCAVKCKKNAILLQY